MEIQLFLIMIQEVISRFNRGQRLTWEEKDVCLKIIKHAAMRLVDVKNSIEWQQNAPPP